MQSMYTPGYGQNPAPTDHNQMQGRPIQGGPPQPLGGPQPPTLPPPGAQPPPAGGPPPGAPQPGGMQPPRGPMGGHQWQGGNFDPSQFRPMQMMNGFSQYMSQMPWAQRMGGFMPNNPYASQMQNIPFIGSLFGAPTQGQ